MQARAGGGRHPGLALPVNVAVVSTVCCRKQPPALALLLIGKWLSWWASAETARLSA
jgi:hypothetical protein